MKAVMRWVAVTIGLTAMWMVTRAVVFYFVGVIAVFATAFQATIQALTRIGDETEDETDRARELRIQRDVRLTPALVDLAAAEEPARQSAV